MIKQNRKNIDESNSSTKDHGDNDFLANPEDHKISILAAVNKLKTIQHEIAMTKNRINATDHKNQKLKHYLVRSQSQQARQRLISERIKATKRENSMRKNELFDQLLKLKQKNNDSRIVNKSTIAQEISSRYKEKNQLYRTIKQERIKNQKTKKLNKSIEIQEKRKHHNEVLRSYVQGRMKIQKSAKQHISNICKDKDSDINDYLEKVKTSKLELKKLQQYDSVKAQQIQETRSIVDDHEKSIEQRKQRQNPELTRKKSVKVRIWGTNGTSLVYGE